MNSAQIHLALNHLPVFGYLLFTPLFVYAIWKKKSELLKVVSIMFVLLSVSAVVIFNSGEGAEELIEDLPGISHDTIHEHEESAELSLWLLSLSGLAAALTFALRLSVEQTKHYKYFVLIALLPLAATFSSLNTAHLGGLIRHPELDDQFESENPQRNDHSIEADEEH